MDKTAELEKRIRKLEDERIQPIMSKELDSNILKALNRALLTGSLALGASGSQSTDISALIALTSTTKGFLFSRMTTTQRNAIVNPTKGLVIYNTTTNRLNFYTGSAWLEIEDTVLSTPSFLAMTRDLTAASGAVATAHGKGRTPRFVKATVFSVAGSAMELTSIGVYDGTNKRCIYYSNNGGNVQANTDSNFSIAVVPVAATDLQTAVITVSATEVILTWTKTGTPSGNAYVLLEVY